MNKLKTDIDGGLPLVLDDLRWIDQGYRNAFYGIVSAFGIVADQETFILSGCGRSVLSGTVTIAEGFVSIGGEICYVPSQSYLEPTGGDLEYWTLDVSYDSAGDKIFQNSVTNQTYEVRIAQIAIAASVPSGHTAYNDTSTFFALIEAQLDKSDSFNLDDSDTYASSKAVHDLYDYTLAALLVKQNAASSVKFTTHFFGTSPSPAGFNIGDIVYVGVSAPYDIYIHNGSSWTILP